ncbi:MAG: phage holin family protein [Thiogranum sp.]|nr:phage holin family protein [Thiogranum sp.]
MFNPSHLVSEFIATGTAKLRLSLYDFGSALVLLIIAASICLLGLVFLLYGIYQSLLLATLPPWMAGAIIALAALLVALLFLLLARRRLTGTRRSPPTGSQPVADISGQITEATERGIRAGEQLSRSVKPVDLALSAFIAGLIASKARRDAGGRKSRSRSGRPPC